MTILTVFKKNDRMANTAYPTKAEFIATMRQLHGDHASYTDMYGTARDVDTIASGRLYIDGVYVGFWAAENQTRKGKKNVSSQNQLPNTGVHGRIARVAAIESTC